MKFGILRSKRKNKKKGKGKGRTEVESEEQTAPQTSKSPFILRRRKNKQKKEEVLENRSSSSHDIKQCGHLLQPKSPSHANPHSILETNPSVPSDKSSASKAMNRAEIIGTNNKTTARERLGVTSDSSIEDVVTSATKPKVPLSSRRRNSGGSKLIINRNKSQKVGAPKESPTEDLSNTRMYESIPALEVTNLPRGGISIETDAVGRIQVGSLKLSFFTFC